MWGSFARTGNPNPSLEYLRVRGYEGSLNIFEGFEWPEYDAANGAEAINIDFPTPYVSGLPWLEKCGVVEELYLLP